MFTNYKISLFASNSGVDPKVLAGSYQALQIQVENDPTLKQKSDPVRQKNVYCYPITGLLRIIRQNTCLQGNFWSFRGDIFGWAVSILWYRLAVYPLDINLRSLDKNVNKRWDKSNSACKRGAVAAARLTNPHRELNLLID